MDQAEERARKAHAKKLVREEAAALRVVLGSKDGRRALWKVFELSGLLTISYTGSSETFFREGRRSVGRELMELIESLETNTYSRLQLEQLERAAREDRELQGAVRSARRGDDADADEE